jgi:hypothetical protein
MRAKEIFGDLTKISLYEMANLNPKETGLDFVVWLSPRDASHDARIKVTLMPWGAHPLAIYTVRPFAFVEGQNWLSSTQEVRLHQWVDLNIQTIIDFWYQRINYDDEMREKIVGLDNAPPGNYKQAVAVLRVIAPKVAAISWHDGVYHLTFNRYKPSAEKIKNRFQEQGYTQPVVLNTKETENGVVLWKKP